jgi:WhiB family redox-sensing transcriptional regulator
MSTKSHGRQGGVVTGFNPRLFDYFAVLCSAATEDAARHDDMSWQDHGLCAETDPEAFFPGKGDDTEAAKNICRACPVRATCLTWAFDHAEYWGIWGGFTEIPRRHARRQYKAGAPVADIIARDNDRHDAKIARRNAAKAARQASRLPDAAEHEGIAA